MREIKNKFKYLVLEYVFIDKNTVDENAVDEAITLLKDLPKFKKFSKETLDDISNEIKTGLNMIFGRLEE